MKGMHKPTTHNIIYIIVLLLILSGCSASRLGRSAEKSYEIGEYYSAIEKYLDASRGEKDPEKIKTYNYYLANAYWYIDDYKKAELRLRNLVDKNHPDSTLILKYAHTQRYKGNYEDAISLYQRFLQIVPGNQEALNGIESCKLTPEWEKNPTRFEVSRERLLSSRDADFSPAFVGGLDNNIIFTSTREGAVGRKKNAITGQRNTDLFKSNFDIQKQRWEKPTP
ncbi:MAG: tetratricopeptide repeat protein, partial [Prolixibacteraceae bacterium]|nr:tetratricopeptide repeat protein [Prolixibacteraceae bacterium]